MLDLQTRVKIANSAHELTTHYVLREKLAVRAFGREYGMLPPAQRVSLDDCIKQASIYTADEYGMRKFAGISQSVLEAGAKFLAPLIEGKLGAIGDMGLGRISTWAKSNAGRTGDALTKSLGRFGNYGLGQVKKTIADNPGWALGGLGLGLATLGRPLARFAMNFGKGALAQTAEAAAGTAAKTVAKPLISKTTKTLLGVGAAGGLGYGAYRGVHSRISNEQQMDAMADPQSAGMYMGYNPEQKV